jgi:hypothetical protein
VTRMAVAQELRLLQARVSSQPSLYPSQPQVLWVL